MGGVKINKVSYGGWENCVQVKNDLVDLIVTTDIGPRIIRYGFIGKENEFCEIDSTLGLTGGDEWRLYGGHRLWHAPESRTRTYEPDNSPVRWEEVENGIKTIQGVERLSRIQKEMEVTLSPEGTRVRIVHHLINKNPWSIELSVWALTAMATGGKEVIPQPDRDTDLLPNRLISLWPYTRLNDPRVYWGERYILLRQDPGIKHPFKFGILNEAGWAGYFNHGHLFIKYYTHYPEKSYPDFGVSYETYTNHFMLEMETLSPLTPLEPDSSVEHREEWELFDDVAMPSDDEDEVKETLQRCIKPSLI
jgi:hypothetical protein